MASLTTTAGHKITTDEFIDAERYFCPDEAFRDKLITDNRAAVGLPIFYAPTGKPMYLETLVAGDPANSVWKLFGGSDNYKGRFTSQSALNTAIPAGQDGWEAIIDTASQDAYIMLWDVDDSKWVRSGSNVTGITAQQASDIETNNSKVGITAAQAAAIVANTAKSGVTTQERTDWNNKENKLVALSPSPTAVGSPVTHHTIDILAAQIDRLESVFEIALVANSTSTTFINLPIVTGFKMIGFYFTTTGENVAHTIKFNTLANQFVHNKISNTIDLTTTGANLFGAIAGKTKRQHQVLCEISLDGADNHVSVKYTSNISR